MEEIKQLIDSIRLMTEEEPIDEALAKIAELATIHENDITEEQHTELSNYAKEKLSGHPYYRFAVVNE